MINLVSEYFLTFIPSCQIQNDKVELGNNDLSSAESSDISVELDNDHSSFGESSDISENFTDENWYELDEDEIKHYKSTLNRSKLFMSTQGFKSSVLFSTPMKIVEDADTLSEDVTSLEYNGKTYYKGSVYEFCHETRGSSIVLVGIISFVDKDLVKCVEIAPFEDTFLGIVTKEIQNEDLLDFKLSDFPDYVQIVFKRGCYLTLPLSLFREKSQELKSIPPMVYEPQTDEDHWEAFAYYHSDGNLGDTINRRGRRFLAPTVTEYFAGAGGSHEAYKAKGFKTHQLVEKDDTAVKSLAANNTQDWDKIIHGCVENALDLQGEVSDVCHFSSPCCGFSLANRNGSANDKSNNDLSLLFVKMLHVKKPKIGCFENVMGMWRRKNVHYLLNIIAGILNAGYQVRCSKLNTSHYGDPQSRCRLFLLASKNGMLLPNVPPKRYGDGLLPLVTVGHVLRKVGGERTSNFEAVGAPSEQQNRLNPLKPSPTIIAQGRQPLHPFDERKINEDDMLMLMSLSPKDFVLKGSRTERRRQVGNMIPFKTMCAIVEEMISVLEFEYDTR